MCILGEQDGLTGECLLYGQLEERAGSLARALVARGFAKGDVVAVLLPNCVQVCSCLTLTLTPGPGDDADLAAPSSPWSLWEWPRLGV